MKKNYLYAHAAILGIALAFAVSVPAAAQGGGQATTASPFLRIAPDARAAAMGDAGAATPADVNALYWNPAKLVFAPGGKGVSLSFSPWMRTIASNAWIGHLGGYFSLPKTGSQALGFSLNYFNQGNIYLRDDTGLSAGELKPSEFAFATTFAQKLGERLSVAATVRYIHSNLLDPGQNAIFSQPGNAVAGDIGVFFQTDPEAYKTKAVNVALGASLTNLGTRMRYIGQPYYLPTNLRLGTAVTYRFGSQDQGRLTLTTDLNKLMVPSVPEYGRDAAGVRTILKGKDPQRPYFSGVFGSFSDSPQGAGGELKEITLSGGAEVRYAEKVALRAGYFRESPNNGGRQYLTAGAGVKLGRLEADASYLVPQQQNHPLAQTVRLTLSWAPEAIKQRRGLNYRDSRVSIYGKKNAFRNRRNPAPTNRKAKSITRKKKIGYSKMLRQQARKREKRSREARRRLGGRR